MIESPSEASQVPVAETPEALIEEARRWQRRRRLRGAALLALAVAGLGLLIGIGRGSFFGGSTHAGARPGGAAPTASGPVVHVVLQTPRSGGGPRPTGTGSMRSEMELITLPSGHARPVEDTFSIWYDPGRRVLHQLSYVDGVLTFDTLEKAVVHYTFISELGDLLTKGSKQTVASGLATIAGRSMLDGHKVIWLRFPSPSKGQVGQEFAVDQTTDRPLAARAICPPCTLTPQLQRIVAATRESEAAANLTPPASNGSFPNTGPSFAHPHESSGAHQVPITTQTARSALPRPGLWAGSSIDGVRFTDAKLVLTAIYANRDRVKANIRSRNRSLLISYGSWRRSPKIHGPLLPGQIPPSISITEAPTPAFTGNGTSFYTARGHVWAFGGIPLPPDGEAVLGPSPPPFSIVQLKKNDLYITITATSPALAIRAAEQLQKIPRPHR
jgi:hypothetical protein